MPGTKELESVRRAQIESAAIRLALESGLAAITVRDVAERAGLSSGLVIFHFGSKNALVLSVLEWVLAETTGPIAEWNISPAGEPIDRLRTLVRDEVLRFSKQIPLVRLFFELWAAGLRNPRIGMRVQVRLDRYREAYLPFSRAALNAHPELFPNVTAQGLAALCASFVKGCAVQLMIEPALENDELLKAADHMLGGFRGFAEAIASNHPGIEGRAGNETIKQKRKNKRKNSASKARAAPRRKSEHSR